MNLHVYRRRIFGSSEREHSFFWLAMVQVARTGGRTLSVVIGVDVLAITERIRRTHLTAEKNEKVSLELELGMQVHLALA